MTPENIQQYILFGRRILRSAEVGLPDTRLDDLDRFRTVHMPRFAGFLRDQRAPLDARRTSLPAERLKQLAVLESTPDLLGPLDHIRQETLHTRALAWALSPARLGGTLGEAPLRAFLELLARHAPPGSPIIDPDWADEAGAAAAIPEHHVPGRGRVDVWLALPQAIFAIEAKVSHVERDGQLSDYRKALDDALARSSGRRGFTVFLARDADDEVSDPDAVRLTWAQLVEAMLPVAAAGETGEHRYLGSWLRTVALHLAELSGHGPFSGWPLARQVRTLALLEGRSN